MDWVIVLTSIQNLGLALLTLLFPLIFYILNSEKNSDLDKEIFLKDTISIISILLGIVLIYYPNFLPFYNYLCLNLVLGTVGIIIIIWYIYNAYSFVLRKDRIKQYKKYLERKSEFEEWWGYVLGSLSVEDGRSGEFIEYFDICTSKIDNILKNKNFEFFSPENALRTLNQYLYKNKSYFYINDNFSSILPKLFNWHWVCWSGRKDSDEKNKKQYYSAFREVDYLISQYFKYLILEQNNLLPGFFFHLKKYINTLDDNMNTYEYINDFSWFDAMFENITELNEMRFFSEDLLMFPKEWLISLDNFQNKKYENVLIVLWQHYSLWAQRKIMLSHGKFDKTLEMVTYDLFPDTDHVLWGEILYFFLSPYSTNSDQDNIEAKLDQFINVKRPLGYMSHIIDFKENPEEFKKYREGISNNTIKLSVKLFGGMFNVNELEIYIEKLEQGKYKEYSGEVGELKDELLKFLSLILFELKNEKQ